MQANNYISTPFVLPSNSEDCGGYFGVSDPFAARLAAARLGNVLRGISEYIRTPFFEPSNSILVDGVYVVQDPIAAFAAAGYPAGPLRGLGDALDYNANLQPDPNDVIPPAVLYALNNPMSLPDPGTAAADYQTWLDSQVASGTPEPSGYAPPSYNANTNLVPASAVKPKTPTLTQWLNGQVSPSVPISRGMALGATTLLVFAMGLAKSRGRR